MKTFLKFLFVLVVVAMAGPAVANAPPAELDTGMEYAIITNPEFDASAAILQSADNYFVSGTIASFSSDPRYSYKSVSPEGVAVPTIRSGVSSTYSYFYNTALSNDLSTWIPYIEWLKPQFLRRE
ncbi:MAG: hypothetical protein WC319_08590 [Candidatus Paceibacterota bacterium]|jgi:hypothetical protein